MNWKLVMELSLFGLVMAAASVSLIPPSVEPYCWFVIFITCAILIAKRADGKYFLHGFCVSLVNSIWITGAHVAFFALYLANHPKEAALLTRMPLPDSPRLMMLFTGPLFGILFGLILGTFSFVAGKMLRKA